MMMARFRATLFMVFALAAAPNGYSLRRSIAEEPSLPGWNGETYDLNPPSQTAKPPDTVVNAKAWFEVLNADARIYLTHHFLTDAECEHIKELAVPFMSRSGVVATTSGASEVSDIRTSKGMFLDRGQDKVVAEIEDRIAKWTLMPVGNGEGLQVLRYEKTQKYDAHFDYFFHKEGTDNGGNRYATVLMYLADTLEGGETVFPNLPAPGGENKGFSECARYHLAVRPRKGDAVLFHSIRPNGELEKRSLHTACPVIRGEKWSAAKWIHVGHYALGGEPTESIEQHPQPMPKSGVPLGCEDKNELCDSWAESGECLRNPTFMVGTRARPGQCLESCKRCDVVTNTGAEARMKRSGSLLGDRDEMR